MTGCQLFRCCPSTPEIPCQVIDQLLVWVCLDQLNFLSSNQNFCARCVLEENNQSKSSLPILRVDIPPVPPQNNKPDECLSERGIHTLQKAQSGRFRVLRLCHVLEENETLFHPQHLHHSTLQHLGFF